MEKQKSKNTPQLQTQIALSTLAPNEILAIDAQPQDLTDPGKRSRKDRVCAAILEKNRMLLPVTQCIQAINLPRDLS